MQAVIKQGDNTMSITTDELAISMECDDSGNCKIAVIDIVNNLKTAFDISGYLLGKLSYKAHRIKHQL